MNKFKIAILLITYKRPKYLRKVLLKIKKINPSILYIYSDGPKNKEESFDVKMCRSIIDDIKWCSVKKKFNTKNMGIELVPKLAIDWVFKENEMAIILEDDTLPSTSFFYFCKKLLIKYKNSTKISMICGTNLAQEKSKNIKDSYFFSKYSNIWGWATWKKKWKHYDSKMKKWKFFEEKNLKLYSYFREEYLWWKKMFKLTYKGKSKNWDYQWTFENFYKNRLSVVPKKNLISNIGINGHGINSNKLFNLKNHKIKFPLTHPKKININYEIDKIICKKTYIMPKLRFRIKKKFLKVFNNFISN